MDKLFTQHALERLASLLRNECRQLLLEDGLQPVQFEVLHYLSICNRYSDTPMAVTEYLGQTKGTVSQTLKVLEKKGLIEKVADTKDKRVSHMKLTINGRQLIEKVTPFPNLEIALTQLDQKQQANLSQSVVELLATLQFANGFRSFGQCRQCRHNIHLKGDQFLCGLTNESLRVDETTLICREHEY